MKLKLTSLLFSFFTFFFGLFFATPVFADTFTLSGTVKDNTATAIEGATVNVYNVGTTTDVVTPTTTDQNGNYSFPSVQEGTYSVQVTPSAGSGYASVIAFNQIISANKILNFILTPAGTLNVSGKLVDASGNAVSHANFSVTPQGSTSSISSTTDDFGNYSFTGAPGIYQFSFSKQPTDPLTNLPRSFQVTFTRNFTTSLTNFDITVPARQVIVHVQDSTNIGVEGVRVEVWDGANRGSADIGSGITNGTTLSRYISFMGNIPATDENGDVILWITPNDQSSLYRLVAIPPSGSPFNTFTLNNVSILGEQTEIISLQYNHATPVTTIDLATEHQDGTYSNPTTVTLSATADTGYTIANTFYKVDGGAQQTYTGPFTVSGNGDHSVEYWSVDNSGVQESHKTKNFTIYTNQAPYVDPFPGASINAGETYTATGSFSDPDSISWTATVDYDEGAGPEPLTLNPDKTFNLSHQYATPGEYQVVVEVRDDGQATGQTVATIYVNGAPEIAALSDEEVNLQDTFMQDGSFTDDDSTSWTATVDYGDGTGEQDLILNPDKTFHLEYTYQQADTYTVIVRIRDNQGAGAMADFEVVVNSPPVIDPLPDVSLQEGGTYTAPGSFTDDDSTNWTATVNYAEGAGIESLPLNPDNTFSLSNLYEENGTYNVAVRITDDKGAFAIETLTVTVNNASPQVEAITASVNPIQVNTSTTATVTFTDAGVFDTHTAVWNWGDGQTTNCPSVDCTLNGANGVWTVSVSHTYTAADVYEINLTVTDDDTGSGQAPPYQYLSVYNPTPQGLFTGVRIYNTGNGQVQFGISAKYQNNVATGDISMNFNAGNIEFESTGITALVITNGNKATVTGNGTVNGQSGYTFLVVGLDGGPGGDDFVRFQIKNGATVIYDSQPGAADTANPTTSVTAGQVIVH